MHENLLRRSCGVNMSKIKVEINCCVIAELRDALNKYYSYTYHGSDSDLVKCFTDSIETLPGDELVQILLGDCSPEDLL